MEMHRVDFAVDRARVVYLTALVVLGLATLRKGHTALFWFAIIFPVLWIVGVLVGPTPKAAAAQANAGLRWWRERASFEAAPRRDSARKTAKRLDAMRARTADVVV